MSTPQSTANLTGCECLIDEDEPPPCSQIEGAEESKILLVCDHANGRVPRSLADLGLPGAALSAHIALDRGALALSLALQALLTCPLIFSNYSRLVIDVNRQLGHPDSVITRSEATDIPGNRNLSAEQIEQRTATFFHPYHRTVTAKIADLNRRHGTCCLIAVHTFTPIYLNVPRRWEFGILWNEDDRISAPLMRCLRDQGYVVGDNEPYSGRDPAGYTIRTHGEKNDLPHVLIEVRDDLVTDIGNRQRLAQHLARDLSLITEQLWANGA